MRALLRFLQRLLPILLCCLPLAAGAARLGAPQLDQLVAPIALYPDPLLSQVLMASTYPAQVAAAAAWAQRHPELSGDEAVQAVQEQGWDPSVQALAGVPDVLSMMGGQPSWVAQLGEAFRSQPKDVMAAVQRLRTRADQAGYLNSNEAQSVVVGADGSLAIEPDDDSELYLPYYDSAVVYGIWPYPAFPPYYFAPFPGHRLNAHHHHDGIHYGSAIPFYYGRWAGCDWSGHHLVVNVARYNQLYPQAPLATRATSLRWSRGALPATQVSAGTAPAVAPSANLAKPAATRPAQPNAAITAQNPAPSAAHPAAAAPSHLAPARLTPVAPPALTVGARYAAAPPPRPAPYPVYRAPAYQAAQPQTAAPRGYAPAPAAGRQAQPAWAAIAPQAPATHPARMAEPSVAPAAAPRSYAHSNAIVYPSWSGGGARGGFSGGGGHR